MICPYCGDTAALVTGDVVYPHRPDLSVRNFYRCVPCGAVVGCHPGTTRALGTLANAELRAARQGAHAAFDPLWMGGTSYSRNAAYRWLRDALGVAAEECHIGMFDLETCRRVVELVRTRSPFADGPSTPDVEPDARSSDEDAAAPHTGRSR